MTPSPLHIPWSTRERAEATSAALAEPDWLRADRLVALQKVSDLPAEPNQLFTPYLDLRSVDLAATEPYPPASMPHSPTRIAGEDGAALLPEGVAALVHVEGDASLTRILSAEARAAGVTVETLAEAAASRPDALRSAIDDGASLPDDDAFGQVARALSTLGIVVHIPDGVHLEQPIVLRWTAGADGRALISRTIIDLGKDAHARIFEEQVALGASGVTTDKATSGWWGTTEIDLGPGATLDFAAEQDFGQSTACFVTRQARVAENATVNWALASVGSRIVRSRIDNLLEGRGASVRQVEIAFGDERQLFDLTSYTRHRGLDTTSDLLSKGVFSGRSRGYIKGLIDIARSARGTDTFLGEFSMLLEKTSRSVTVPSLEIDQPDVRRAMHSSSVGPIDETQVFYLMSRGLSREAARKAIVLGFLEPVVARIPLPAMQDRLRTLLESKWPDAGPAEAAA